jgi:transcriptional regulator with GAF, ATPase, and Fis domain
MRRCAEPVRQLRVVGRHGEPEAPERELEPIARRFREELYFRLAGFPIRVPPLRERREEIPTLALFFMERASCGRGVRFESSARHFW